MRALRRVVALRKNKPCAALLANQAQRRERMDFPTLFCYIPRQGGAGCTPTPPPIHDLTGKGARVQVLVRDNNVDQALKALKKKMQREGIFREMKLRGHYEKPSEKKAREKAEAIRRARKLARKRLQREGLLPMKPKPAAAAAGRAGPPRAPRLG
jgi:small subunit ribosomal protein S21